MQKKNEENVIAKNDVKTDFVKKISIMSENFSNIYNDTQANLFNKTKTLLLINY